MRAALLAAGSPPAKLPRTAVIYGCIDIGSNTTRLLVAEAGGGELRELTARRAFTRIGRSLRDVGSIPAEKIAETADVAAAYAREAFEAGAAEVVAVATAAIRDASNRDELAAAVRERAGLELEVLSGAEEARLSFEGATRTLPEPPRGSVAVVDVGGGSTEVAVGEHDAGVRWSDSVRVGSGLVADAYLRSDPPGPVELEAARHYVAEAIDHLRPPPAESAVAVGGTATSLHRLVGPELNERTLDQGAEVLCQAPSAEVAERFGLDPERVRLLPAGILVLGAVCGRLGVPLRIARGGLREGVVLELAEKRAA